MRPGVPLVQVVLLFAWALFGIERVNAGALYPRVAESVNGSSASVSPSSSTAYVSSQRSSSGSEAVLSSTSQAISEFTSTLPMTSRASGDTSQVSSSKALKESSSPSSVKSIDSGPDPLGSSYEPSSLYLSAEKYGSSDGSDWFSDLAFDSGIVGSVTQAKSSIPSTSENPSRNSLGIATRTSISTASSSTESPSPSNTQSTTESSSPSDTQTTTESPSPSNAQSTTESSSPSNTQTTTEASSADDTQTTTGTSNSSDTQTTTETPSPNDTQSTTESPSTSNAQTTTESSSPSNTQTTTGTSSPSNTQTTTETSSADDTQTTTGTSKSSDTQTTTETSSADNTQTTTETSSADDTQTTTGTSKSSDTQTTTDTPSPNDTQSTTESPSPSNAQTTTESSSPSNTQTTNVSSSPSNTQTTVEAPSPSATRYTTESATPSSALSVTEYSASLGTQTATKSPTSSGTRYTDEKRTTSDASSTTDSPTPDLITESSTSRDTQDSSESTIESFTPTSIQSTPDITKSSGHQATKETSIISSTSSRVDRSSTKDTQSKIDSYSINTGKSSTDLKTESSSSRATPTETNNVDTSISEGLTQSTQRVTESFTSSDTQTLPDTSSVNAGRSSTELSTSRSASSGVQITTENSAQTSSPTTIEGSTRSDAQAVESSTPSTLQPTTKSPTPSDTPSTTESLAQVTDSLSSNDGSVASGNLSPSATSSNLMSSTDSDAQSVTKSSRTTAPGSAPTSSAMDESITTSSAQAATGSSPLSTPHDYTRSSQLLTRTGSFSTTIPVTTEVSTSSDAQLPTTNSVKSESAEITSSTMTKTSSQDDRNSDFLGVTTTSTPLTATRSTQERSLMQDFNSQSSAVLTSQSFKQSETPLITQPSSARPRTTFTSSPLSGVQTSIGPTSLTEETSTDLFQSKTSSVSTILTSIASYTLASTPSRSQKSEAVPSSHDSILNPKSSASTTTKVLSPTSITQSLPEESSIMSTSKLVLTRYDSTDSTASYASNVESTSRGPETHSTSSSSTKVLSALFLSSASDLTQLSGSISSTTSPDEAISHLGSTSKSDTFITSGANSQSLGSFYTSRASTTQSLQQSGSAVLLTDSTQSSQLTDATLSVSSVTGSNTRLNTLRSSSRVAASTTNSFDVTATQSTVVTRSGEQSTGRVSRTESRSTLTGVETASLASVSVTTLLSLTSPHSTTTLHGAHTSESNLISSKYGGNTGSGTRTIISTSGSQSPSSIGVISGDAPTSTFLSKPSQSVAGSRTSSDWLPTLLVTASATESVNTQSSFDTAATATLPQFIVPSTPVSIPANYSQITIGFQKALNYPFLIKNPLASAQIFGFLPDVLRYPFVSRFDRTTNVSESQPWRYFKEFPRDGHLENTNLSEDERKLKNGLTNHIFEDGQALQYRMHNRTGAFSANFSEVVVSSIIPLIISGNDYIASVAIVYFPTSAVNVLQKMILNSASMLYSNPDSTQESLALLIDPKIPITGLVDSDGSSGSGDGSGGSGSSGDGGDSGSSSSGSGSSTNASTDDRNLGTLGGFDFFHMSFSVAKKLIIFLPVFLVSIALWVLLGLLFFGGLVGSKNKNKQDPLPDKKWSVDEKALQSYFDPHPDVEKYPGSAWSSTSDSNSDDFRSEEDLLAVGNGLFFSRSTGLTYQVGPDGNFYYAGRTDDVYPKNQGAFQATNTGDQDKNLNAVTTLFKEGEVNNEALHLSQVGQDLDEIIVDEDGNVELPLADLEQLSFEENNTDTIESYNNQQYYKMNQLLSAITGADIQDALTSSGHETTGEGIPSNYNEVKDAPLSSESSNLVAQLSGGDENLEDYFYSEIEPLEDPEEAHIAQSDSEDSNDVEDFNVDSDTEEEWEREEHYEEGDEEGDEADDVNDIHIGEFDELDEEMYRRLSSVSGITGFRGGSSGSNTFPSVVLPHNSSTKPSSFEQSGTNSTASEGRRGTGSSTLLRNVPAMYPNQNGSVDGAVTSGSGTQTDRTSSSTWLGGAKNLNSADLLRSDKVVRPHHASKSAGLRKEKSKNIHTALRKHKKSVGGSSAQKQSAFERTRSVTVSEKEKSKRASFRRSIADTLHSANVFGGTGRKRSSTVNEVGPRGHTREEVHNIRISGPIYSENSLG